MRERSLRETEGRKTFVQRRLGETLTTLRDLAIARMGCLASDHANHATRIGCLDSLVLSAAVAADVVDVGGCWRRVVNHQRAFRPSCLRCRFVSPPRKALQSKGGNQCEGRSRDVRGVRRRERQEKVFGGSWMRMRITTLEEEEEKRRKIPNTLLFFQSLSLAQQKAVWSRLVDLIGLTGSRRRFGVT